MKLWYIKIQDGISEMIEREILFSEEYNLAVRKNIAKNQKVMSPPQQVYLMGTKEEIDFIKEELENPQNTVRQLELIGVPICSLEPVIELFRAISEKKGEIGLLQKAAMEWFDSVKPKE